MCICIIIGIYLKGLGNLDKLGLQRSKRLYSHLYLYVYSDLYVYLYQYRYQRGRNLD